MDHRYSIEIGLWISVGGKEGIPRRENMWVFGFGFGLARCINGTTPEDRSPSLTLREGAPKGDWVPLGTFRGMRDTPFRDQNEGQRPAGAVGTGGIQCTPRPMVGWREVWNSEQRNQWTKTPRGRFVKSFDEMIDRQNNRGASGGGARGEERAGEQPPKISAK